MFHLRWVKKIFLQIEKKQKKMKCVDGREKYLNNFSNLHPKKTPRWPAAHVIDSYVVQVMVN